MSETATLARIGRPSLYSEELAERICTTLSNGMTLRELGRQEWAPDHATMYRWGEKHPTFRDALARARKASASLLIDDGLAALEAVDTDSPYGNARVSKARELFGAKRYIAGCLDESWSDRTRLDVKGTLAIVAFQGFGMDFQQDE